MPAILASPTGWLGPYLNILPLISVVVHDGQQKMFMPPPTDEQQQMQQNDHEVHDGLLGLHVLSGCPPVCVCTSLPPVPGGLAERKLLPKSKASAKGGSVKSGQSTAGNGAARAAERKRLKQKRR